MYTYQFCDDLMKLCSLEVESVSHQDLSDINIQLIEVINILLNFYYSSTVLMLKIVAHQSL